MSERIDSFFTTDPGEWIATLPAFHKSSVEQMLGAGRTYDQVAESWLTASAANTFRLGSAPLVAPKETFLSHVKREVRAYLCGDQRYEKERAGLFGDQAATRTLLVSSIAVTIAPSLGVAAPVLAPIVTLVLASIGKVALNAWCAATAE